LQEAERRHASELTTAAAQLAERQAQYDAKMAQGAAARETIGQQVRDAERALDQAHQAWAADTAAAAERFIRREAELAATLAEATATRQTLELGWPTPRPRGSRPNSAPRPNSWPPRTLRSARASSKSVLAQELANRESLERDLADTRAAGEHARQSFLDEPRLCCCERASTRDSSRSCLPENEVDHESIRAEMQEEIRHLRLERDTLHQSLHTSQEQLEGLKSASRAAREDFERARMTSEGELQRLAADYADAQQMLEQVRTDLEQTLERVSSEHAAERARLETLVTDRDAQLEEQAARHSASQTAANNALAQVEDGLRLALEARSRDRREIEQLQEALEALGQQLEATRSDRELLRTEADRVPQLQNQLDDSWAENRRQFEQTPYGICRCGRDGALKHVNHALVALLRYRTSDELRTVDFANNIFESGDDLRLLIERCVSSGAVESLETHVEKKRHQPPCRAVVRPPGCL
jgi:chromosome segregation ATPase